MINHTKGLFLKVLDRLLVHAHGYLECSHDHASDRDISITIKSLLTVRQSHPKCSRLAL